MCAFKRLISCHADSKCSITVACVFETQYLVTFNKFVNITHKKAAEQNYIEKKVFYFFQRDTKKKKNSNYSGK